MLTLLGYPGPVIGYPGPVLGYPGPVLGYPGMVIGYPGPVLGYPVATPLEAGGPLIMQVPFTFRRHMCHCTGAPRAFGGGLHRLF